MPVEPYTTPSAWLRAVDAGLRDPSVLAGLAQRDLPTALVRTVARAEAAHTTPAGVATLDVEELARLAGVSSALAARGRLALVTMGLEVLTTPAHGEVARQLLLPRGFETDAPAP